ncbi:MAG: hypothetical protein Q9159_003159 [Coniocarpon cinnabarinum]
MGWNSYNYYSCYPNETIMHHNAQGLVDLGFARLGYDIVTTDCGWPSRDRTADGQITWDPALFPSGFPALGDFVHGLGLKFGMYSGAGIWECDVVGGSDHRQASLGHEQLDASTFASWGMDALKYDNCWASNATFVNYNLSDPTLSTRFADMSNALDSLNRSVIYQICEWGSGYNLGTWAAAEGDSWRISNDIQDNWSSIWRIANEVIPYVKYTGLGRYPDMDMLTIGLRALSDAEEKFEFTLWAINKSPLTIGAPMDTSLTPASSLDILSNEDVIAINQDALAEQAALVRRYTEEEYDIWAGNLSGLRKVVAVTNWSNDTNVVSVDLASILGLANAGEIKDIWGGAMVEPASLQMNLSLVGHEARLFVLSDLTYSPPRAPGVYYDAREATVAGAANLVTCDSACQPTGQKVREIVNGSSVSFTNVTSDSQQSMRLLGVDVTNYDVALPTGTNTRNLTISVNGRTAKRFAFPISGGNWTDTGRLNLVLDGFVMGSNSLTFGAQQSTNGPDLVGFELL